MMLKIKVSYERPEELQEVLGLLAPIVIRYKVKKGKEGQYNRAYIEADSGRKSEYSQRFQNKRITNVANVSKTTNSERSDKMPD